MVIDFTGMTEMEARQSFPEAYQHLLVTVKLMRDEAAAKSSAPDSTEYARRWWTFAKSRQSLRTAIEGTRRYIATTQTSLHRVFTFIDAEILPDQQIVVVVADDPAILGFMSSRIHTEWALRAGGWLGVGNDPRYNNSKVFDPFPFPDPTPEQRTAIAELAEELDATRKLAIAETDKLTMTELYNLRAKLRSGVPLTDAEQRRATKARAGIVDRLHEQLDQAVADAYGWGAEWAAGALGPSEIVARLVALNHERAAEEAAGQVRWLRPEYQIPRFGKGKKEKVEPRQ